MPNWKKVIVSGSNASLNSLTVTTNVTAHSLTGSLFGTASYAVNALTASYALNARDSVVTVAKDNITQGTASYFNFTGSGVTVTTTNGTSSINIPGATTIGGQGTSVLHTQSSPSTTWNFTHNLGSTYVTYDIFDASNNAIIPQTVNATLNTLTITFSTPQSGYAVATVGGGLPTISASYANYILAVNQTGTAAQWVSASGLSVNSASFATTASYAFNAITASHALTASSADSFLVRTALTASGLRYPTADGLENQVLKTDGTNDLLFGDVNTMYETVYTGENITKSDPLYISGSQGAKPIVYKADAANPNKMPVTFIASETIGVGNDSRGIVLGLIEGINLTGYTAGTEVFVAPGGGWTSTRPTGSAIVQVLGIVTKGGSGGKGLILNPGPVNLPNLNSGSIWIGNSNGVPVAATTSSIKNVISSSYASTASYVNPLVQNVIITGSLIVSGSSTFTNIGPANLNGNTTVTGSLGVLGNIITTGDITAQTLIVSTVSSSVVYSSGSNIFGNNLSNTQQLTGSVSITGSLTVNNIDLLASSASFSTRTTNLESTSSVLTTASASFAVVSGSYSSMSGSTSTRVTNLENASGSFSTRVTNTEVTASSLVLASGSFSTRVTGLESASGSFSTRVTTLETASGSFSTRITNTEATASNLVPRVVNLESTSSNLTNASASFSTRVTSAETNITNLQTASGSFSVRVTNTEATASNLVPRVVNLESTASSLVNASSSFSTRVTSAETSITTLTNASASFASVSSSYSPMSGSTSTRLTSLESASGSFSSRVTTAESNITNLQTASGSFSTRVTNTEATASNLVPRVVLLETTASNFVLTSGSVSSRVTNLEVTASSLTTITTNLTNASASFSIRMTNEEATGSRLVTASGSYSTRVTNLEATSSTVVSSVNSLNSKTGSYAVTASNQFKADQSITGSLLVTGNVGIGTTAPAAKLDITNSSADYTAIIRNTSAGGDYLKMIGDSGNTVFEFGSGGTGGDGYINIYSDNSLKTLVNADGVSYFNGGNVGIGTTSPDAALNIYNGVTEGKYLNVDALTGFAGIGSGSGAMITFNNNGDGNNVLIRTNNSARTDAAALAVWNQNNSRFIVLNNGNVGIGTTTPGFKLDVNGNARILGGSTYLGEANVASGHLNAYELMTFNIDIDNDDTNRYFAWYTNAADGAGSELMRLTEAGNVGIGSISPGYKLDVNGTARVTTLIETSSKRYKKNIKTLPSQLEVINELRPVTFKWKDKTKGEDIQYGLIAEEVQTIVPEAVALNDKGETEAVSYTKLVPILIKAVQELQAKVEALENKRQ